MSAPESASSISWSDSFAASSPISGSPPAPSPRVVSGPQYLTKKWRENGDGVTAFDAKLFYPYLWSALRPVKERFPDAYAVHHWGNRRRERGQAL